MIYDNIINFSTNNIGFLVFLGIVLVLTITEFLVVCFAKQNKNRGTIVSDTILIKFISLVLATLISSAIATVFLFVLVLIDEIVENYFAVLSSFGIIALVVLFFMVNIPIVRKYSKEAKHNKKFRKGTKLKALKSERCKEGDKTITPDYKYEFVKNADYDLIVIRSLSPESSWEGEVRTFSEEYFKKK